MLDHVIAHQFYLGSVPAKLLFTHPPTPRAASFWGTPSVARPPPSPSRCGFAMDWQILLPLKLFVFSNSKMAVTAGYLPLPLLPA